MPLAGDRVVGQKQIVPKKIKVGEYELYADAIPETPKEFGLEAKTYWHFYCSNLLQGRCLKKIYVVSVYNLCVLHSIRKDYMDQISQEGILLTEHYIDINGFPQIRRKHNPVVDKLQKLICDMDRLLASLGMTAYTDKVLEYDSSGGQLLKGQNYGPPLVDAPPPPVQVNVQVNLSPENSVD